MVRATAIAPKPIASFSQLSSALGIADVNAANDAHRPRWSVWRRRQQARARTCHYRRQANGP
jgi:hypothetical protein